MVGTIIFTCVTTKIDPTDVTVYKERKSKVIAGNDPEKAKALFNPNNYEYYCKIC